ncbi:S26 family signal peptidase [Halorussus sp. MSC15.2]|uniref:S26 family signal peptidase n=1 Tax=Halorussus sp. MSC15.2 TaxID=2283638 RepID=UPI001F083D00|nr:S26 family signal peptidase [Halorussus sp. MSC15.2]
MFQRNGRERTTPIIHRARFWVNESENWYDEANPNHVPGDSCADVTNCPAPNAGFVTLGDANRYYDQAVGRSRPVRPSWIRGTAEVRVPYLGHIRLALQ